MPRQLEHVVAVARLAGALGDEGSDSVGRAEMLAFRIAADDIAVMADDAIADEAGSGLVLAVAGQFVEAREADQLGDHGVGVWPRMLIVPRVAGLETLATDDAQGWPESARGRGDHDGNGDAIVQEVP